MKNLKIKSKPDYNRIAKMNLGKRVWRPTRLASLLLQDFSIPPFPHEEAARNLV